MKWKFNPKTGRMEQEKRTGVEVSARQGGIMVEDFDRHIQFLINYGTSKITHCFGCKPTDIHLFDDNNARAIAERVRRIGTGRGIDKSLFDYRAYSAKNKNFNMTENNHSNDEQFFNDLHKDSTAYQYRHYIEERLNELMPRTEAVNESTDTEEANNDFSKIHTDKAPKVKGYFKLISLRYMKSVKDIKKMCIEYINTYIDSCMNVAMKMKDDQVKLVDSVNSLAKDLNFAAKGASTKDAEKTSDNLKGVLFLTGDKALLDKLNAILEKIKLRSNKSEQLRNWAKLMIEQSKIVANEIVFKETNKMIKDENEREKAEAAQKKAMKEAQKQYEQDNNEVNKQAKEEEREADLLGGDPSEATSKITSDDLKEVGKLTTDDFEKAEPVTDKDNKEDGGEKSELQKNIEGWMSKYGNPSEDVYKKYKEVLDAKKDAGGDDYTNAEKQFLFGAIWADHTDIKNDDVPAPAYIVYICSNCEALRQALSKHQMSDSEYVELGKYKIDGLDGDKLLKDSNTVGDTKAFYEKAGKEWKYFFSKEYTEVKDKSEKSNESRYVMSSEDFINEKYNR